MSAPTPTHLVIVDYLGDYEGPSVEECYSEAEADAEYLRRLQHEADVTLVEVKRSSTWASRRVSGSVDQ